MKNVTIKDIAKELGVSKSTVSRALRDSWEISEETKERIRTLANKLDYNPNPSAQNLHKNLCNDIGVIVPDIANPFFSIVIAGIEDVAFAKGFHVIIYQSHDNYEREVLNVKHVFSRRKDGLLVSLATSTQDYAHFKHLKDKGFPIVFFDRVCEQIDTHKVSVDDFEGAFKATEHLIKQGCKKIGHVAGPPQLLISQRRLDGYKAALLKYGLEINENLILYSSYNPSHAAEIMRNFLKTNTKAVDGIFASSDNIAIGCHSAIIDSGLKMPDDIALIGFSDLPIAALLNPPLSSMAQPAFEMGQSAAELLIDMIKNPTENPKLITNILKTQLIVRKSSVRN